MNFDKLNKELDEQIAALSVEIDCLKKIAIVNKLTEELCELQQKHGFASSYISFSQENLAGLTLLSPSPAGTAEQPSPELLGSLGPDVEANSALNIDLGSYVSASANGLKYTSASVPYPSFLKYNKDDSDDHQ